MKLWLEKRKLRYVRTSTCLSRSMFLLSTTYTRPFPVPPCVSQSRPPIPNSENLPMFLSPFPSTSPFFYIYGFADRVCVCMYVCATVTRRTIGAEQTAGSLAGEHAAGRPAVNMFDHSGWLAGNSRLNHGRSLAYAARVRRCCWRPARDGSEARVRIG